MARLPGFLEWHGQRHTKDEWAAIIGISRQALEQRLKRMPYDKVFTMPKKAINPMALCTYPDCFSCPLPDCYVDSPKEGAKIASI